MITIDQLLESVDLDFEPRWVTKDLGKHIEFWSEKPKQGVTSWRIDTEGTIFCSFGSSTLKLSEFDGKDWTECIYEVPRKEKPVVKIEKLNLLNDSALLWGKKINELVDAVNELKGE